MFDSPWIAAGIALFAWWFFTGAILVAARRVDRDGPQTRLHAVFWGAPVAIVGGIGFTNTLNNESIWAVYVAFFSALAIWGWIELTFLTGVITGPVRGERRKDAPEWERFIRAWGTIAYHEMLLAFTLLIMMGVGYGHANQFGVWTFAILFAARVSAKLNLYLGVPKINTEFIPQALHHLPSHFRAAQMNWLFPVSVTAAGVAGFALLAALTALALLEHWFLVLSLGDEKLWRWMLPKRAASP